MIKYINNMYYKKKQVNNTETINVLKNVILMCIIAIMLQSCYTQQQVYKIESGCDTNRYEKSYFESNLLKCLRTTEAVKIFENDYKYLYQYNIEKEVEFKYETRNNKLVAIKISKNDTSDSVQVIRYGVEKVPTDLYYDQYSFWKTTGLIIIISFCGALLILK